MRIASRLTFVLLALLNATGPLLAAPLAVAHGAAVSAPQAPHSTVRSVLTALAYGLGAFGTIRLKDLGSLSQKFVNRAGAATGDYADGVKQAGGDWEQKTKSAAGTWKQAITEVAGTDRFERGVSEAGAAKYQSRASTLGAQRYAPGVQASAGDWSKGFAPYHQALQGMDLPPRAPRGSPQNQQISNAVASRLAAIKRGKSA